MYEAKSKLYSHSLQNILFIDKHLPEQSICQSTPWAMHKAHSHSLSICCSYRCGGWLISPNTKRLWCSIHIVLISLDAARAFITAVFCDHSMVSQPIKLEEQTQLFWILVLTYKGNRTSLSRMVCLLFVQMLNLFLQIEQQFYYHLKKKQVHNKEETGQYDHLLVLLVITKRKKGVCRWEGIKRCKIICSFDAALSLELAIMAGWCYYQPLVF